MAGSASIAAPKTLNAANTNYITTRASFVTSHTSKINLGLQR
jgi:hypothetical protein